MKQVHADYFCMSCIGKETKRADESDSYPPVFTLLPAVLKCSLLYLRDASEFLIDFKSICFNIIITKPRSLSLLNEAHQLESSKTRQLQKDAWYLDFSTGGMEADVGVARGACRTCRESGLTWCPPNVGRFGRASLLRW